MHTRPQSTSAADPASHSPDRCFSARTISPTAGRNEPPVLRIVRAAFVPPRTGRTRNRTMNALQIVRLFFQRHITSIHTQAVKLLHHLLWCLRRVLPISLENSIYARLFGIRPDNPLGTLHKSTEFSKRFPAPGPLCMPDISRPFPLSLRGSRGKFQRERLLTSEPTSFVMSEPFRHHDRRANH